MPAFLTWTRDGSAGEDVLASYIALLAKRLAELLAHLRRTDPACCDSLSTALDTASDGALEMVLCLPVISSSLLRLHTATASETADALLAEFSRRRDLERATVPAFDDVPTLTVDYRSEHARRVDLSGETAELKRERELPSPAWSAGVDSQLRCALDGIGVVSESTREFVTTFNRVVIAQPNDAAPGRFSSGSTRRFIGRSALGNPDCISTAGLAAALVHEGIHALLYMQSPQRNWVCDEIGVDVRVTSPWTGTSLEIESFLQACFVWYGLLHFWALAAETGAFPASAVEACLRECSRGFLETPLTTIAAAASNAVPDLVLETIDALQARVTGGVAGGECERRVTSS